MFNLDTILKTLNSYNISSHKYGPTIYQNGDKIGVAIDIKDSVFGFLSRAFTFKDNSSLEEFLKKYTWYKNNYKELNIDLSLDAYDTKEPNIKYTYNNKELTLEEMLNFKNLINEKNTKLINDEQKNIYLTNIRELTNYLIELKNKKEQTKATKNKLKIAENDLKFELIKSLAVYYGQNKNFEKKAVSLDNILPNNDIALLKNNLTNIATKSLEEIKNYLNTLVTLTKEEELDDKNLINIYSNNVYRYNIEILNKQIAFVKNKIASEKNFNAKGSKIHNIDAELKSFLKTNIAPTKIETFIAESKKNINSKYERLTDIKDAYSTISGNKLAATNITINNNVYNKNNVITDLITRYNNLDSQTKAHLVLYNSFYKPICNFIINNNYPPLELIKEKFDFDYFYKSFEEIIYNENNSHYLVNYFKYINFKNLDSFINSLIEICKTITNTNFIPIGDIKAFGINDDNIYKSLTTNPLYNKKDVHLITITPINKIIFIPEKIELNEDTKELNKTETNNIYVKCNIADTNNTITINKYNKVESKYNNSDIIITTDLILNSETTFHIGRIEGE